MAKHSKKGNRKTSKRILLLSLLSIVFVIVLLSSCNYLTDNFHNRPNWYKDSDSNIYYLDKNNNKLTGWHKIDGYMYFFNEDGNLQKTMKAIDVSKYQKDIDWKLVYNAGIKLAMIRSSYGWMDYPSQVDSKFHKNMEGAARAGVKVGVYHFSYATNINEAEQEADYCLRTIQGYDIQLPVAYDIEEEKHENLSKEECTEIAIAFCEKIKKAGYTPIIYSSIDFIESKFIAKKISPYNLWIAQYAPECTYEGNYLMWQYTTSGKIDGVEKNLDFNYYYFESSIKKFAQK